MTSAATRARLGQHAMGGDRGTSTTEAALVTPLLVAVMLFVVLCGRLVSAQMDLDAAASAAARSASLARTDAAAHAAADHTARETLAARAVTCQQVSVTVATGGLQPGGAVTVTLACAVPLSDLALLSVPGTRTVTATATSPIDAWRGATS
ncbi:TadE/TadG family type IV pilus assembly protein [Micromonospora sp. NBC_01813]|uniref:TadE/TadG family type IV pilus assembly protein n=1 Tax=Micromonospora sp. NBC_01813 TaxID=2975988 RepID=UPI002DDA87FB|nr:TadE/TadG family type IV pilus assembly protein [Micromonospora sp. NBC_01813]WSA06832.1 pilus assembly protein [Micromonospora sp. NBC_01813]